MCGGLCVCFFFSERKMPFYPPPLLNWKVAQEKVPWGIVLLLGGGFAVAKGCEVTPPSLTAQDPLPPPRGCPEMGLTPQPHLSATSGLVRLRICLFHLTAHSSSSGIACSSRKPASRNAIMQGATPPLYSFYSWPRRHQGL